MKTITPFLLLILIFFGIVYLVGYTAEPYYEGQVSELLRDSDVTIWEILQDVESYSFRKTDVKEVNFVKNNLGHTAWYESLKGGGLRQFTITKSKYPSLIVTEFFNSRIEKSGQLTFMLTQTNRGTVLTISEKSRIESVWYRGIESIAGRDNTLRQEMKWIRVALFGRLLTAP